MQFAFKNKNFLMYYQISPSLAPILVSETLTNSLKQYFALRALMFTFGQNWCNLLFKTKFSYILPNFSQFGPKTVPKTQTNTQNNFCVTWSNVYFHAKLMHFAFENKNFPMFCRISSQMGSKTISEIWSNFLKQYFSLRIPMFTFGRNGCSLPLKT